MNTCTGLRQSSCDSLGRRKRHAAPRLTRGRRQSARYAHERLGRPHPQECVGAVLLPALKVCGGLRDRLPPHRQRLVAHLQPPATASLSLSALSHEQTPPQTNTASQSVTPHDTSGERPPGSTARRGLLIVVPGTPPLPPPHEKNGGGFSPRASLRRAGARRGASAAGWRSVAPPGACAGRRRSWRAVSILNFVIRTGVT
jgi:hypothetical protein